MSTSVRVRPEAEADVIQTEQWLERKRTGLGQDFVIEVLALLDRIRESPQMFGEVDDGVRAANLNRFGHVIFYRIHEVEVEILAILHSSRSQNEWQRRLD